MEIRRATRDEVAEVDALLAASGLPALPQGQSLSNLLVALEDGTVVGAVALEVAARRGLLRSLVVREGHRGKGLGSGLVSSLISRGHELGLRDLYVLTETADDFFTGREFTVVDRADVPPEIRATREFREQCPESARVLRFQLETRL
jgi:amino-acid N-acetyltransferase